MSKNQTITAPYVVSLVEHQALNKQLPHATIFHGQNTRILYETMIQLARKINQAIIMPPTILSETPIEPSEDIVIINPVKTIKLDAIKTLLDRIKYGPSGKPYCIVIIHNIQRLTNGSANALLKSIEDPPKNTLFFLSTANKCNVPITILSRSQLFHCPESEEERAKDLATLIDDISQKINYMDPLEFLNKSKFEQTIFMQNLPYDTELLLALLTAWVYVLHKNWPTIEKKEHDFLQKIIEIISNIKYNFNLKLQLLAVTLQTQEDDLQ